MCRPVNKGSETMVPPLVVGLGAGEGIDAVVLGMAAVSLDPVPFDSVWSSDGKQLFPQLGAGKDASDESA